MALFAHCASQTVNAVKVPWERKPRALETADKLASALALDMTRTGRRRCELIRPRDEGAHPDAVREAVSGEAADRIASMKKQPMAEAAEQLLAGTGWLPPLMRTAPVAEASGGSVEDIGATEASEGFPGSRRVNRRGRGRIARPRPVSDIARECSGAPDRRGRRPDRTTAGHETMKTDAKQRATLTCMETAHAETARHLPSSSGRLKRAERMTTSSRVKARQFGRASATWSRADERDVQG